jgi:hypothetical protein
MIVKVILLLERKLLELLQKLLQNFLIIILQEMSLAYLI